MPQGDKTGPQGQGPMTGRAMGYCAGFNTPGFMNAGFGRGMGRGFGRGRGFAFRQAIIQPQVIAQPKVITEAQEKELLKQELETIKAEQTEIQARLK